MYTHPLAPVSDEDEEKEKRNRRRIEQQRKTLPIFPGSSITVLRNTGTYTSVSSFSSK